MFGLHTKIVFFFFFDSRVFFVQNNFIHILALSFVVFLSCTDKRRESTQKNYYLIHSHSQFASLCSGFFISSFSLILVLFILLGEQKRTSFSARSSETSSAEEFANKFSWKCFSFSRRPPSISTNKKLFFFCEASKKKQPTSFWWLFWSADYFFLFSLSQAEKSFLLHFRFRETIQWWNVLPLCVDMKFTFHRAHSVIAFVATLYFPRKCLNVFEEKLS